jgi:hypothetical protein
MFVTFQRLDPVTNIQKHNLIELIYHYHKLSNLILKSVLLLNTFICIIRNSDY